jgi:hypothetical protein
MMHYQVKIDILQIVHWQRESLDSSGDDRNEILSILHCSYSAINLPSSQPFDRDLMMQIYRVLQYCEFTIVLCMIFSKKYYNTLYLNKY